MVQPKARFLISPESISEISSAQLLWLTCNIEKKLSLIKKEENEGQNLHSRHGAPRDKSSKHFPLSGEHFQKSEVKGEKESGFQHKIQNIQLNLNFNDKPQIL